MRILFVVPNVPSRIRARPFNLVRRLSRRHEVCAFCVATDESDYRFIPELRECCQTLEVVELSRWRSFWNCLIALLSSQALRNAYFYSSYLRQRVKEKVDRGQVDLVHAEHLKSVPMVEGVTGSIPTVFDAVDCMSMLQARRRRVIRNPLLRLFLWTEWKKTMHCEARACERFNRVVISSAADRESYPGSIHLKEKIHIVPNGVDLEYFSFQQFEHRKNVVIFCAKLDYFANVDAALYFSQSVWPLLLARRPYLELEIVGSRPPRSVRQLDGKDNIRVVGSVSDVRPYLGSASVALCPLRVQAGTQFKILEAMALGVPVVATRICCAGLGVEPEKHLLVADVPEQFVNAVELLLDNPDLRDGLVRAARNYVEIHYDWDHSVQDLLDAYSSALADFKRSRRESLPVSQRSQAARSSDAM